MGAPTFLAARVYDDGPGRLRLEEACAENPSRYAHCIFVGHTYFNHNDMLWGGVPGQPKPNFITNTPELNRALRQEETTFVLNAIAERPVMQIEASLGNAFRAVFTVGILEVEYDAIHVMNFLGGEDPLALAYLPGMQRCLAGKDACREANVVSTVWRYGVASTTLIALGGFVLILAAWYAGHPSRTRPLQLNADHRFLIGVFLLVLMLGNAAICGAFSGVHDRYQRHLGVAAVPAGGAAAAENGAADAPARACEDVGLIPQPAAEWRFADGRREGQMTAGGGRPRTTG